MDTQERKPRTYSGPGSRTGTGNRPAGGAGRSAGAAGRSGGASGRPGARGVAGAAGAANRTSSAQSRTEGMQQEAEPKAQETTAKETKESNKFGFSDTLKKGAKAAATPTFSKENREKAKKAASNAKRGFKGLLDRIYSDVGASLKSWGRITGGIGLGAAFFFCGVSIISFVAALVTLLLGEDWTATIVLIVAGSALILSLISLVTIPMSWFLYGFGQMLDDVRAMRANGAGMGGSVYETNPEDLPEL